MRYHVFYSVFTILLLTSCRDPIDLTFVAEDVKLVVDGHITNVRQRHEIRVSYSSGFTDDGVFVFNPVTDATVRIEDDLGQVIPLTHFSAGRYLTEVFKASADRQYRAVVITENGRFSSTFQHLPEYKETASVTYELAEREVLSGNRIVNQKGIGIYAHLSKVDAPVFYHWQQRHYYVYEALRYAEIIDPIGNRFCFVRDFDRIQLDIAQKVPGGSPGLVELDFFKPSGGKTWHEYAVEVVQLITNSESFEFWEQIQRQTQNVGSLFDPSPSTILGNITDEEGNGVLGFFGVYNQSSDYVFFNNCELPRDFRSNLPSCPETQADFWRRRKPCYDCLNQPGFSAQTEIPSWWRPIVPALGTSSRQPCPGPS